MATFKAPSCTPWILLRPARGCTRIPIETPSGESRRDNSSVFKLSYHLLHLFSTSQAVPPTEFFDESEKPAPVCVVLHIQRSFA